MKMTGITIHRVLVFFFYFKQLKGADLGWYFNCYMKSRDYCYCYYYYYYNACIIIIHIYIEIIYIISAPKAQWHDEFVMVTLAYPSIDSSGLTSLLHHLNKTSDQTSGKHVRDMNTPSNPTFI